MQHGERTSSRAPKKLFAGIAALGLAAGAYGVYATTLTVAGNAGTDLQAGSIAVDPTAGCQTDEMTVTEIFSESEFTDTSGYSAPTRTGWTITGIANGCADQVIALAVNSTAGGGFVEVGTATYSGTSGSITYSVPTDYAASATEEADTVGYSIKIAST